MKTFYRLLNEVLSIGRKHEKTKQRIEKRIKICKSQSDARICLETNISLQYYGWNTRPKKIRFAFGKSTKLMEIYERVIGLDEVSDTTGENLSKVIKSYI